MPYSANEPWSRLADPYDFRSRQSWRKESQSLSFSCNEFVEIRQLTYCFVASQTLLASPAAFMNISPSDAVALHVPLDVSADILNYTSSLVTETLICASVVLVGTAKSGVGDFDKDFIGTELFRGGGLADLAILRTSVNCE